MEKKVIFARTQGESDNNFHSHLYKTFNLKNVHGSFNIMFSSAST